MCSYIWQVRIIPDISVSGIVLWRSIDILVDRRTILTRPRHSCRHSIGHTTRAFITRGAVILICQSVIEPCWLDFHTHVVALSLIPYSLSSVVAAEIWEVCACKRTLLTRPPISCGTSATDRTLTFIDPWSSQRERSLPELCRANTVLSPPLIQWHHCKYHHV